MFVSFIYCKALYNLEFIKLILKIIKKLLNLLILDKHNKLNNKTKLKYYIKEMKTFIT